MYAECVHFLVFGVSRMTWFYFSKCCLAVVLRFPQSMLAVCLLGFTQIFFFFIRVFGT